MDSSVTNEPLTSDPAVLVAVSMFERLPRNRFRDLGVDAARAFADIRRIGEPVHGVDDLTIPGGAGQPLRLRLYRPEGQPTATVMFLHGGGWVIGSVESYDAVCRSLCNAAQAAIVSVDYRLAPEHPYPAALDDAYAATAWVADHCEELGLPGDRLVLAGDSAGANLAAAVCQRARDENAPAITLQLLIYPGLDDVSDRPSMQVNANAPFLDSGDIAWFRDLYLQNTAAGSYTWPGSAVDLSDLPPAFVQVAEFDALRDSGTAYVQRLQAAGVEAELRSYPLFHSFLTITPQAEAAQAALADAGARIQELVSA